MMSNSGMRTYPTLKLKLGISGKGHISVWYDKWIDNVYLCNVVPYVDISDTDLRLRDLFENEAWNFNKLYT